VDLSASFAEVSRRFDELDGIDREITTALADDDLDTAEAGLAARRAALTAMEEAIRAMEAAWVSAPASLTDACRESALEVVRRLNVFGAGAAAIEEALQDATGRAQDGLHRVRAGRRLNRHQRPRGETPPGGWCDVKR